MVSSELVGRGDCTKSFPPLFHSSPSTWSSPGLGGKWLRAHWYPLCPREGAHSCRRGCHCCRRRCCRRRHWTNLTSTWWVQGSPSAGRLWLGGISRDRRGGPPQMGLHVAGQLGRGLAVHAAQFAQDAVSPRGLEPMVLHRVDAQVCCCGEAFVAELTDMVRALAVHLHVVRNISRAQHLATHMTWHLLLVSYCVRPESILRSKSCLTFLTFEGPFC